MRMMRNMLFLTLMFLLTDTTSYTTSLTIQNKDFDGIMHISIFDEKEHRIGIAQLYKDQSITFHSGSKAIQKIRWQTQEEVLKKTFRYELRISIAWYMPTGGIFMLYRDGSYKSLFFGHGKVEGELSYFWKSVEELSF